jgi:hypothetical protein
VFKCVRARKQGSGKRPAALKARGFLGRSEVVKVALSSGAVIGLAAFVVGGCGGAARDYGKADALRMANVRPAASGWTWPRNPSPPEWDSSTAGAPTDPALREFVRETADLVSVGDASKEWEDGDKLGHVDVGVYGSASDARRAMGPLNVLSRKFAVRTGRVTAAGPVDGIGDEAWRLAVTGNGPQVTYHWRRGNLVIEAHVHCFGTCPADLDAVATAWAAEIDRAARAGS